MRVGTAEEQRAQKLMSAVVSEDHASPGLCAEALAASSSDGCRLIFADEIRAHNGKGGPFWAVVDGFVVDATEFLDGHPGGLKKLLSTNAATTGATLGREFDFSFSRGRNAHFPGTGKRFRDGVKRYLGGRETPKPPERVAFPPHGGIVILGRLDK